MPAWSTPARTIAYGALIASAAIGFRLVAFAGRDLAAAASPAPAARAAAPRSDALMHVLLALIVVILTARVVGALFRRLGQPPVMGEVLAGILLGPSLLGRVAPGVASFLLPPAVAPHLAVIAQIGVILYMFLVGLELDPDLLKHRGHTAVAISHASIVAPFLLGAILALGIYEREATRDVPFPTFALFLGVSMSVTAFPVLARILTDRGMAKSPMGALALSCAAADDVTAWCLLALLVSVVHAHVASAAVTFLLTLAFLAFMLVVGKSLASRLAPEGTGTASQAAVAIALVCLLASALVTELIGIHAIFGAFLLGAVIPHRSSLARDLTAKLRDIVASLLLPAFFAFTGMRTEVGLVRGAPSWATCAIVVLVASAGKLGGTSLAARVTGLPWRDAIALGVLMNTRGLMELIVLNVGLDLGIIAPRLFAMLVLMAIVTTLATTPALDRLSQRAAWRMEIEQAA
ncbi:MAG: cation:proton antiporter [Acidobacteriota bacterium]